MNLPRSDFVSNLISINHLDQIGFDRFIFFPGMLFDSFETWWGGKEIRHSSHEGVDLCFFINDQGEKYRLDETTHVPTLFAGSIVHVMGDFLGKTIVVSHNLDGSEQKGFYSFYAHMQPDPQIIIGDSVKDGQPLGTIAGALDISLTVISHLHISMAWQELIPPVNHLTWDRLNRLDRAAFIDPIAALAPAYTVLADMPDDDFASFIKCSLVLNLKNRGVPC